MERDNLYIQHILEEIRAIESFVLGMSFADFASDQKTTNAVERSLEIIGEAAKRFSPSFRDATPSIPWVDVAGLRDKIIHHYFDIDHAVVWEVLQTDIPVMKKILEGYIKESK